MRVAIYARFSSDLQDIRSIADQLALAREHAARQGWHVVAEFTDAAISGARRLVGRYLTTRSSASLSASSSAAGLPWSAGASPVRASRMVRRSMACAMRWDGTRSRIVRAAAAPGTAC